MDRVRFRFWPFAAMFIAASARGDAPPPNAYANPYGPGWLCEKGFSRVGNACEPVIVPSNAHLNYFGNGWDCDKGFSRDGEGCVALEIPENAHLNYFGNDWECDRGFRQDGQTCVAVIVPENASLDYSGHDWSCNRGYRVVAGKCDVIIVPENAQLDFSGNQWMCQKGFKPLGDKCAEMTPEEKAAQEIAMKQVMERIRARKTNGIGQQGCDTETETGAEVCVTIDNVDLECSEFIGGDYYTGCDSEISYSLQTDYDGEEYIDATIECSVEISFKGRQLYVTGSDSDDDWQQHSLYANDSHSDSLDFDFSFNAFSEVFSVEISEAACEVTSIEAYE